MLNSYLARLLTSVTTLTPKDLWSQAVEVVPPKWLEMARHHPPVLFDGLTPFIKPPSVWCPSFPLLPSLEMENLQVSSWSIQMTRLYHCHNMLLNCFTEFQTVGKTHSSNNISPSSTELSAELPSMIVIQTFRVTSFQLTNRYHLLRLPACEDQRPPGKIWNTL